ncbi:MAG TPA: putative collagen-binding domain-containing protein, partial [Bryobacteraceae bacterium]|nr:putative collagen-binding domain-containing protein [Bryobacteraceae bacterium]
DRQKWFTYALSRLAGYDVTWQGIEGWESYDNGRELLKEIADYIAALDPYKHTRSTRVTDSSGPLVDDGWLRYRSYQGGDHAVAAIDQQVYQYPSVSNFASESVDADTFRHRLWNATVSGEYPSTVIPNEQAANEMKIWYEFMEGTRHWELEPFFDADNGRGLSLEEVEYIIYVEKPGPVTVNLDEKHGYDGRWFNPATGQSVKLKEIKAKEFTGEPPDRTHDWVLQISRESHKASMLKSYKFDSRDPGIELQQVEGNPDKVPFEVVEPSGDTLSLSRPASFSIKLKRETKALQHMMYEWTGEVTVDGRSYRVIGTGANGTLRVPANIARNYPAALHIRIFGMNGLGKVYALDRNYTLTK